LTTKFRNKILVSHVLAVAAHFTAIPTVALRIIATFNNITTVTVYIIATVVVNLPSPPATKVQATVT